MKPERFQRLLFVVALAASFVGVWSVALAGGADDDSTLDAEFLDRLARERVAMCMEGVEPTDAEARRWCAVRLSVSRKDLNKDGSYELIVFIAQMAFCGASNCPLHVYKRRDGEWVFLTGGENGFETFDDPESEWPVLIFYGRRGQIWRETEDGGAYMSFCASDRCRSEQG